MSVRWNELPLGDMLLLSAMVGEQVNNLGYRSTFQISDI